MATLTIPNEDLLATLQAQRNEAWDACARNGAALQAAIRQIDDLTAKLEEANKRLAEPRPASD